MVVPRELLVAAIIASLGTAAITVTYIQSRAKETRDIEVAWGDATAEQASRVQRQLDQALLGQSTSNTAPGFRRCHFRARTQPTRCTGRVDS